MSGNDLQTFISTHLGLKNNLQSILSSFGTSSGYHVLIDGLDQIKYDLNKERILKELINTVRRFNENIIQTGATKEKCWQIILTTRTDNLSTVLYPLVDISEFSNATIEIPPLTSEEISFVVEKIPRLTHLYSKGHLKNILSLPLILDILSRDFEFNLDEIPDIVTEYWFLERFWQVIVRNNERVIPMRGNPEKREQTLLFIGREKSGLCP
jgi:hypothetical protein